MTKVEFCSLWIRARDKIVGEGNAIDALNASKEIAHLMELEYNYPNSYEKLAKKCDDNHINILRMLAGPHSKTILAAMKARKS